MDHKDKKTGFDRDAPKKSILGGSGPSLTDQARATFGPPQPGNDNATPPNTPKVPRPADFGDDGDDNDDWHLLMPELQPGFFESVRRLFAEREEVVRAIDRLDRLHPETMGTARTLLLDLLMDVPADRLNIMIAASFLRTDSTFGAARQDREFDPETIAIAEELRGIRKSDGFATRLHKAARFSPGAQCVVAADLITDMEQTTKISEFMPEIMPTIKQVADKALLVKTLSRLEGVEPALVDHAITAFNDLSILARSPIALIRNNELEIQSVVKKPGRPGPKPPPPAR